MDTTCMYPHSATSIAHTSMLLPVPTARGLRHTREWWKEEVVIEKEKDTVSTKKNTASLSTVWNHAIPNAELVYFSNWMPLHTSSAETSKVCQCMIVACHPSVYYAQIHNRLLLCPGKCQARLHKVSPEKSRAMLHIMKVFIWIWLLQIETDYIFFFQLKYLNQHQLKRPISMHRH